MHVATCDYAVWDMKSYWADHNRIIGQCLVSPCEQAFLIDIPKNASTYCRNLLSDWRLGDYLVEDVSTMQCLILLRDPVKRWISGLGQCLTSTQSKFLIEENTGIFANFIEQLVILDPHTEKQKNFIHNIDTNRLTCFMVDKNQNLHSNFTSYLNTNFNMKLPEIPEDIVVAPGEKTLYNEARLLELRDFFTKRLENIPGLLESIQRRYAEDYKLINYYHDLNLFYNKE